MRKTFRLVVFWILMILSACGQNAPVETATPTETPEPLMSFVTPLDGATINYDDLRFQVNPVDGAEGYAWIFIQNGNVIWDTLKDEQRLADTEYSVPDTGSLNDKLVPGELQVQVKTRIKGVWTEPIIITVYIPARATASIPTSTKLPTKAPASTSTKTKIPIETSGMLENLGPIAYYTNDYITLINPDGSNQQTIFKHPNPSNSVKFTAGFSWSPDGQSLAYATSTWSDIYIFSLKELTARNITNLKGKFETDPDWSPNGKRIVFTGDVEKPGIFDIYTMYTDGSHIRQLTDCSSDCEQPDWSPTGEYIAYVNYLDIYIMKFDGSEQKQLTHGGVNTQPIWSPDGKFIAFIRSLNYDTPTYLYLMRPDGTDLEALTDETVSPRQFSWSPNGKFIVFDNFPQNGPLATLMLLNIQSGETKQLTGGLAYAPEWSPILLSPINLPEIKSLADCTSGWSRLQAGKQAMVLGTDGSSPNRVRSEPKTGDNIIGMLPPGTAMDVLEGPLCADGFVFWKVYSPTIPGGAGWTAEGDGKEYWLEPMK